MAEKKKGKLILTTTIKRVKGKLYYCGTSEDGMVAIYETPMAYAKKDKKEDKKEAK